MSTETFSVSYTNVMNKLLPVVLKLEEKSETVALCLVELQNCLLSFDVVSEDMNYSSYRQVTYLRLESEMPVLRKSLMGR